MQSVILLYVTYKPIVLNVIMLSVVWLNVIMLSVVAPNDKHLFIVIFHISMILCS
jgi:hypothetical protein